MAVYWGAACGGCCVSVLDVHEKLFDVTANADLVFWPIALDIKYQDVDIPAGCQDVIHTAVGDVVGRAVTQEYPIGFLGEEFFHAEDFSQQGVVLVGRQEGFELVAIAPRPLGVFHVVQPSLQGVLDILGDSAIKIVERR